MELLERDTYLDALHSIHRRMVAEGGQIALVCGEAGIGKTSLVQRFAETHPKTPVLWGACDALFTPRPLGPLYDIAMQTGGNLLALLNSEPDRNSIFTALLRELREQKMPAVAVFEDVHWADEATLDLLKFFGRRLQGSRVMWILTYRDDELGIDHPLWSVLGDLPPRFTTRIRLLPLSEAAVVALARRAGRTAEGLYAATGGNPFFVTEVLAGGPNEEVPATVREAVLARARRSTPAARTLLDLASVVPGKLETWLFERVLQPSADTVAACAGGGLVRLEPDGLVFRHELARLAVEEALPPLLARRLHQHVLRALLAEKGHPVSTTRIVHHAALAGDAELVLHFAPLAARQAATLGSHREAAAHYQTALRHADRLPAERLRAAERAQLLEALAYECYLTSQIDEAAQARRDALAIWQELGRQDKEGENLRWLSRVSWFLGQNAEAERYASQAVETLKSLPPGPELAMAYSNQAQLYMLSGRAPEAVDRGTRALELAERLGSVEIQAHALNNVGTAEWYLGQREWGRARLEESLRLALAHDLQEHVARAYSNLASTATVDRAYPPALRYAQEGIAYAIERDLDSWVLYIMGWLARIHLEQGRWTEAEEAATRVLGRSPRSSVISRIQPLVVLARVRSRRGDPGAGPLLDEARDLAARTGEIQRIGPVAAARAEAAWSRGKLAEAVAEASAALSLARARYEPRSLAELQFWIWRAGGPADLLEADDTPYGLQRRGDWRSAATAWQELGCPYEQAMALADGGEDSRRAALAIFEGLGATPAAEALRRTSREAGVRGLPRGPRPATRGNPLGLTAREMEVLALLAEGLSNADIATRLVVSPKTVDHHVSGVLSKLGARSRSEAVKLGTDHGLLPRHGGPSEPK